MLSPPSGRRGSGCRSQADGMVVPPGGGLVPSAPGGPAQPEGKLGWGKAPCCPVGGQAGEPDGLGDREPDQAQPTRAGLAGGCGGGRVAGRDAQGSVGNGGVGVAGAGGARPRGGGGGRGAPPGD